MILTLLSKPTGRGNLRCWVGFLFDTDVQSEVEQFMLDVHQRHYFLVEPLELKKTAAGNFLYNGLWVCKTSVHVKTCGMHTTFTLKT